MVIGCGHDDGHLSGGQVESMTERHFERCSLGRWGESNSIMVKCHGLCCNNHNVLDRAIKGFLDRR